VPVAKVSALTGEGIPTLLELILLQAEVMELKADPRGKVEGVVIEAKLDKGRGPVATVLVKEGTLKRGDALVVGSTYGRIRQMLDYRGEVLNEAGPSTPVEVLGLNDVPLAGDVVEVCEDERAARNLAEQRQQSDRDKSLAAPSRGITLADLRKRMNEDELKDLNLVVKADVQGSVEAVKGLVEKIKSDEVNVRVIHSGVGTITESDILLASAAGAICIGFNVRPEGGAKKEAERRKVEIRTYTIIYELIEDIEAAVKGMLEPKFQEEYLGTAEIRVVFNLSRHGMVAGSHCTDGKLVRNCLVRVKRDKDIVYEGKITSLKHVKEDVREITQGFDCGIQFDNWTGFKEGDIVEAYELVQI
jgi:translation initiation factor IF-2